MVEEQMLLRAEMADAIGARLASWFGAMLRPARRPEAVQAAVSAAVEALEAPPSATSGAKARAAAPKTKKAPPRKAKRASAAAKAARSRAALKSVGPLRVLVGEPNGVHQLQLRTLLAQIGARPEIAASGAQLVEAWRREAWNLILIDIQSPEFGLETARTIRAAELKSGWACTPIVALGGRANAETRAIVDSRVAKPLAGPGLVAAIERALAAEAPTCTAELALAQVA